MTLIDTIKRKVGMSEGQSPSALSRIRRYAKKKSVDIDVTICPEHRQQDLIEACDSDGVERWLYAGTPSGSEIIWLLKGEADEPYTDDAPERRVYDAINHETMHAVISFVEDEDTSDQYDEFIREVLPVTTYLHRYAQFTEIEEELAKSEREY